MPDHEIHALAFNELVTYIMEKKKYVTGDSDPATFKPADLTKIYTAT